MLFSSITFLFYFLPITLICYFAAPKSLRNLILLIASLLFYAWGEPKYVFLMIVTIGLFYGYGILIERSENQRIKKSVLIASIITGVVLLFVFKYIDFFIQCLNQITGLGVPYLHVKLPIGISFYTFQCLGYVIDVYRGNVPAQRNVISFGTYVAMFPQLIAGPIVRYADIADKLENREVSMEGFSYGIRRFIVGLSKKVLLANQFAVLGQVCSQSQSQTVVLLWLGSIAYSLQILYDFSGYSDMAIGLGAIFGFQFTENFRSPFVSKSATEFWRRWHISLGSWFREYVYIPLGGNRCSKQRHIVNIFTVWALTGLWHGASWTFVVWGLLFAVVLLLEKYTKFQNRLPSAAQHIYLLLLVNFSFVIFQADTLGSAVKTILGMCGFTGYGFLSTETLYYLRSFAVLLIAGAFFATEIPAKVRLAVEKNKHFWLFELIILLALFVLCTAYLVDGSFNPFLYFRF